jgi:NADH-quinone oxidoreductase subunit E
MAGEAMMKTAPNSKAQEGLISSLKKMQREFGHVSEDHLAELARSLGLPISEVYGVATFYSFLSVKPLGRNVIRVCKSLPCYLQNCLAIINAIKDNLGIEPGETTGDSKFSLELANCIGACDKAPAMLINDQIYGNLTPQKITDILRSYK